jgi:hypothetical protein
VGKLEKILKKCEEAKNNTQYSDIAWLLIKCGFELKADKPTHKVFIHRHLIEHVNIVVDGNRVKHGLYVEKALRAIEKVTSK